MPIPMKRRFTMANTNSLRHGAAVQAQRFSGSNPVSWGHWIEFKGEYNPELAKALKSILTVDFNRMSPDERQTVVYNQLQIRGLAGVVAESALLAQWERFQAFTQQRFTPASQIAQFPIEAWKGQRLFRWEADLYLNTGHRPVLCTFAGFAEGMKKWQAQAKTLAPALVWSRRFLTPEPTCWLVFPVEGQAVEILAK
jgi:hypothetical protein